MQSTPKFAHNPSVRLDATTLDRIDALRALFSTDWRSATRSETLRACLLRGLATVEADPAQLPLARS